MTIQPSTPCLEIVYSICEGRGETRAMLLMSRRWRSQGCHHRRGRFCIDICGAADGVECSQKAGASLWVFPGIFFHTTLNAIATTSANRAFPDQPDNLFPTTRKGPPTEEGAIQREKFSPVNLREHLKCVDISHDHHASLHHRPSTSTRVMRSHFSGSIDKEHVCSSPVQAIQG